MHLVASFDFQIFVVAILHSCHELSGESTVLKKSLESQVANGHSVFVKENGSDLVSGLGAFVLEDGAGQFDGHIEVSWGHGTEHLGRSLGLVANENPVGDGQDYFGRCHFLFWGASTIVACLS